jgi:hypothetical protein
LFKNLDLYLGGDPSSSGCGGIKMIEVARWQEKPSKEERAAGIQEVLLTEWIYLGELDYDFSSNERHFVRLILGIHREERRKPLHE